jgi:hypothetical protein
MKLILHFPPPVGEITGSRSSSLARRLLSAEAAEAPGTPTAEAKRPQRAAAPQPSGALSERPSNELAEAPDLAAAASAAAAGRGPAPEAPDPVAAAASAASPSRLGAAPGHVEDGQPLETSAGTTSIASAVPEIPRETTCHQLEASALLNGEHAGELVRVEDVELMRQAHLAQACSSQATDPHSHAALS